MSLMGVDVGTSSCKAVVFANDGKEIAAAARAYGAAHPQPSHAEMDPEVLWTAVASAIAEAASGTTTDPVSALAVSSHGETFVLLDADGRPLRPAVLNSDARALSQAQAWRTEPGPEAVFDITGQSIQPMYPVFKLQWLKAHEPDAFSRAQGVAGVADFVLGRLGVRRFIDYSLASRFLLFDIRGKRWHPKLLAAAGLPEAILPEPAPAGTIAGELPSAIASDLGLTPGLPVVVAGHDQPTGAVGMGAIEGGTVCDSLGSYECILAVSDARALTPEAFESGLDSYCHTVPGRYVTIGYFPAGAAVQWYVESFCEADAESARKLGKDVFEVLESRAPAGPSGIAFLPHLIGSGTPHYDATARGLAYGFSPETDRYALYKAVLEGIACELAVVSQLLGDVTGPFDTIRVSGGGARSALGLQLRATLTGRAVQPVQTAEAVCLGAALLAGVATGTYSDLPEAVAAAVHTDEPIMPSGREEYAAHLTRHRRLYDALSAIRETAS